MKEASRVINVLTKYQAETEGQLEMAAMTEHARQGKLVQELNDLSKEIDIISDHIHLRKTCEKLKPFHEEWRSKGKLFQKSYYKKYETEISRYTESKATLKAAYPDSKVPSLEEMREKKKALLRERSEKNDEYNEIKVTLKEVEFARTTLEQYLSQQRDMEQRKKRKRGDLE